MNIEINVGYTLLYDTIYHYILNSRCIYHNIQGLYVQTVSKIRDGFSSSAQILRHNNETMSECEYRIVYSIAGHSDKLLHYRRAVKCSGDVACSEPWLARAGRPKFEYMMVQTGN